MQYVPGLIKKTLPKWSGKQWYHQRFDGSPYFIHFIAEAEIMNHEERKEGADFVAHYCFFENGKADWYIEMEDIKKVYTAVIKNGKGDLKWSDRLMANWKDDEKNFYAGCGKINKTDFKKLSDAELGKLHNWFVELVLNRNSSSSIIDGFALGTDQLLADKIKSFYDKSLVKEKMRFTEVFSIATAPVHTSFINEAEVSLLRIASAVKRDPNVRYKQLSEHQRRFFWIHNNYVDAYVLSIEQFGEELDKMLATYKNPEEDARRIEHLPEEHKKAKAEIMKALSPDSEVLFLLKVSEDFTHWQDERKKATLWTMQYASLVLNEISCRVGIPTKLLKYMSPREVGLIFKTPPTTAELEKREINSVFYWDKSGYEVLVGKDSDEVKVKILGNTDLSHVTDFRGLTASMGRAIGKVKVLKSVTEIGKVEEGDILVAVMTRPDYVPAMKKAAAIVTDEGGVTSHAAIVARELRKPCIIGTKIATKVLKDGMMVEVNANHGMVKII